MKRVCTLLTCAMLWSATAFTPAQQRSTVSNDFVVTLDGLRWQELFGGMQGEMLTRAAGGIGNAAPVEQRFGGATPEERREKMMPFFWSILAKQGQVFGDATRNSVARVTNGLLFSYPGYNEILS